MGHITDYFPGSSVSNLGGKWIYTAKIFQGAYHQKQQALSSV
jgi:hypothetical protein